MENPAGQTLITDPRFGPRNWQRFFGSIGLCAGSQINQRLPHHQRGVVVGERKFFAVATIDI